MGLANFAFALKEGDSFIHSGCSAARLARVVRDDEAGGSNPLTPTPSAKAIAKAGLFFATLAQLVEQRPDPLKARVGIMHG